MKKTEAECCDVVAAHTDIIREVRAKMPGEVTIQELADFYKVFGDATRIRILCALLQAEVCVCDLAELLGMSQSAISHQLRILKQMRPPGPAGKSLPTRAMKKQSPSRWAIPLHLT